MAQVTWILLTALFAFLRVPLAHAQHGASPGQHKEAFDSLLQSLFDLKIQAKDREDLSLPAARRLELPAFSKKLSAPLAHPKAPISNSYQLLRVTGAQAALAAGQNDADFKPDAAKKYEYLHELRREFEKKNK